MAESITPHPDNEALAREAYDWLKKRRSKREISIFEVLMKIKGYKWGDKELKELEDEDLFRFEDCLLKIIEEENEYVADFSAYENMCVGMPYSIPFVFRKK